MTAVTGQGHYGHLDHGDLPGDAVVLDVPVRGAPAARSDTRQTQLAITLILLLTAFLTMWGLDRNGFANTYYAAAAQAAAADWRAMFFGALDAPGWITIDKPPLSTWVMGLSVRIFGLSAWSLLLPQALMGVATVGILFATVRRWAGAKAGLLAALVLALTPVVVLIFRFNDPDALLTLLLVAAAWALTRAIDDDRARWLVLSGLLVGLGFQTKFMQAFLVLPAFGLVLLVGGAGSVLRRFGGLLVAAITVLVASGWWVALVEAIPLDQRPFTGGSATGGPLDLLLGYDGLGRILGQGGAGPGGSGQGGAFGGAGALFGGPAGPFRLLGAPWDGGVGWLLPIAVVLTGIGLGSALLAARRTGRRDRRLLGWLLWGGWLLTHTVVFSFMSGIVHSYYAVTLAPAMAAVVGMGLRDLWTWRATSRTGGIVLGGCVAGSAWWAYHVLGLTPDFLPWLAPLVLGLGIVAGVILAMPVRMPTTAARVTMAVAIGALLLGPAAYSLATVERSQTGGDPVPGPAAAAQGGVGGFIRGGLSRGFGGGPGPVPGADVRQNGLAAWLLEHHTTQDWIVATTGAMDAAALQLAAGQPVLSMGGFMGSDPSPTAVQLAQLVSSGRLRYVLLGGGGGFGGLMGGTASRERQDWVRSRCTPVSDPSLGGSDGQRATLYDCAAS